jgi:hypothetical protein
VTRTPLILSLFGGAAATLWEPGKRRDEMTMFLIPRFLTAFTIFLQRRLPWIPKSVPLLKTVLFMMAVSSIAYAEHNEPTVMKPIVKTFCAKVLN